MDQREYPTDELFASSRGLLVSRFLLEERKKQAVSMIYLRFILYFVLFSVFFLVGVRRMGEKTCPKVVLRLGRWNFLHHRRAGRDLHRRRWLQTLCRRRRTKGDHGGFGL